MDQQIGRYQILEEIASGGQGTVYRAYDPEGGQIIALKVLHPTLVGDRTYVERFRREAALAASIDHPNVVKIFEVGQDGDRYFIALEFLPESLAGIIERVGQLRIEGAARYGVQIADGLAAAHALGIVHRDVKPQNVLIGQDGTAKVTDFGIARGEAFNTMTATGVMMGTPHYMSPEQSRGERADARSDVYSLGCMVYQMLAGEVPFKADTPLAVLLQHVNEQPRLLRELRRDIPQELEAVVERSMAKDQRRRYQSVAEMARALRAAVPDLAAPVSPPHREPTPPPQTPTPTQRPTSTPRSALPDPPREGAATAARPATNEPRGAHHRARLRSDARVGGPDELSRVQQAPSRLRSVARFGGGGLLAILGLSIGLRGIGEASEFRFSSGSLVVISGVLALIVALMILRRSWFQTSGLGRRRLYMLFAALSYAAYLAGGVLGPEAGTIPEGGPEAVALVPGPAPTAAPASVLTAPPAPVAAPGRVPPAQQPSTGATGAAPARALVSAPVAAAAPAEAPGTEVSVQLTDAKGLGPFEFDPLDLSFDAGEVVNFSFTSESQLHTFTVDDLGIDVTVDGGETVGFSFTFDKPGTYKLICIPHQALGMVGTITVSDTAAPQAQAPAPAPAPAANPVPIEAAIKRLYQLWDEKRWSEVWESYTNGWREKCSFDAMVAYLSEGNQGVSRREVSRFNNIYLLDGRASVSYTVVRFDDAGHEISTYDYEVTLVREDDEWLWEEGCFPEHAVAPDPAPVTKAAPAPSAASHCSVLQEGIYRGYVYNITYASRSDTKATLTQSEVDPEIRIGG